MEKLEVIGDHRHVWGDSTQKETWETLFSEQLQSTKAQVILADPPYCLLTRRNKKTGQKRDPKNTKINHEAVRRFENVKEYRHFTKGWLHPALERLSHDGFIIIWTNFLGKEPIFTEMKAFPEFHYWDSFVWGKYSKEGQGNEKLCRVYEEAMVFSKKEKPVLRPSDPALTWSVIGLYDDHGEATQFDNHPNHKSYNVIEPLIRNFSAPGDLIIDPFTGSGSTPSACHKLARKCFGVELRENWASTTRKRLQESE